MATKEVRVKKMRILALTGAAIVAAKLGMKRARRVTSW
jgi:hypothetical protein